MEESGLVYGQYDEDVRSEEYALIERAITFLEQNFRRQPSLKDIAASVNLSEYHFQRLFSHWVGISPKRFLQFLSKEYAKTLLEKSGNLLDVTYQTGLSSPGRLHDLFVTCEAVTPGQFKNRGEDMLITYGFHPSPFGECLLAMTERGICDLAFVQEDRRQMLDMLRSRWKKADFQQDDAHTRPWVNPIFARLQGQPVPPLRLFLSGTNFQIKVWEALLRIPPGCAVSYQDIAVYIGMPGASRAVGSAVGQNPVSVLVPCHRVLRKAGDLGGYRWGTIRKKSLIAWEAARFNSGTNGARIDVN